MFFRWLLTRLQCRLKHLKNFRYPVVVLISSILIASMTSVWISQGITLYSMQEALQWMWVHPIPVWLDILVLTAFSVIVWAISRKIWIAFLLPAVGVYVFSMINYYKTLINSAPLLYSDLSHASGFFSIAHFALPQMGVDMPLLGIALFLILIAVILHFIDQHIAVGKKSRLSLAAVGLIFFMVFCWTDCFQKPAAAIAMEYKTQEERIESCGSLWAFYCAYAAAEQGESEYSTEDMRSLISYLNMMNQIAENSDTSDTSEETAQNNEKIYPNVIFVMSESFFDVTRLPNVQFFQDPLPNYHRLAQQYTSGRFLSNTCNGGTGYVEMEVLTGFCGHLLNEGDTLCSLKPNEVYDVMPSITRVFKDNGYDLTFIHAHTPELYNRPEIYSRFGFDTLVFSEDFMVESYIKGDYIADDSFADELIARYEQRDKEKPLMMMGVTMENHQPSYKDKFEQEAEIPFSSDRLDEKGKEVLTSYLTGVHDADASLGKLTDYFSQVEEPVMLVFWGDHMPSMMLNNAETIYSCLGVYNSPASITWSTEELKNILATDYLIWTNYLEEPVPDHTESCTLLGLSVLKQLHFTLNGYYAWLDSEIAPNMLLYRPRIFVDAKGNAYDTIPEEYQGIMRNYAMLTYDIIYGENEILSSLQATP